MNFKEEFEKLAATGKISRQQIEPLVQLATHGYCTHRSWGFGRVTAVDVVLGRCLIDFQSKKGHAMDLAFAAASLTPVPKDHILARKAADLAGLRQMAALHHLDLVRVVLQSHGGRATPDQIQQALVPDVIADDYKKWWEVAKREMKKDGHFLVPAKKTDPVVLQEGETTLQDRLLADFRAAKGLKAKLVVTHELVKSAHDLSDRLAVAAEVLPVLNADIASHLRTQQALALEAIFARDDLRHGTGATALPGEPTAGGIWQQNPRLNRLLEEIAATKHRRALHSFQESSPLWFETLLGILNIVSAKLCHECVQVLAQGGHLGRVRDTLGRLVSQHQASSELLLWLGKERSDAFADILGPEVFRAMLTAMERDAFNEKKSNRLRDFILGDMELIEGLVGSADIEVIKDLTRALQLSPSFDDMDKRSLLARLVKAHPAVQSLISGEQARQEATLVVSWPSLERRKHEYEDLVKVQIPANSKEIAIARSYGDLRENHEYKAAKEMQKVLMRRKSELETQLGRARGTDFANPKTDTVSIGTTVTVTVTDGPRETYTLLGAWDGDPDSGVLSYLTPLAQSMMGRAPGAAVDFELEGTTKHFRIESIVAAAKLP
jgi:transcription elongation GreA/GreB family factor/transcription elongation factor GreA-like protein